MVASVKPAFQYATPESQGINSAAILKFVEAVESQIHELHSFMLLRHGQVVAEGWWSPYGRENAHVLFSLSKSFTSTAIGLAVAEGLLSIDDSVLSFFPDLAPAEVNEHLAAMQVRHLLSMSTGHDVDTTGFMIERPDGLWSRAFLEVPVIHKPGTHFLYNTGATYMLSAILQRITGQQLVDYLEPRLFKPLGIENAVWDESPERVSIGGFGLSIKTEDIAKFGQLYLQKGVWEGKQLIPAAWVEEATTSHISNGDDPASDWAQGYGYQFWRCQHNAYRGDGAFGQFCVVMPEQDAVLAITAGLGDMQEPLNLVWDILLPAMQNDALPEDAEAQQKLTAKLASLALPPVQGIFSPSATEQLSNRVYKVTNNELNLETISLNFTATGCTINLKTNRGAESFPCGYGQWVYGETTLFNEFWRPEPRKTATSAAWTDATTLTMLIRLHETPFVQRVLFHFADDQLKIEMRVNVDFIPPQTRVLIGHTIL